jgi:xylan 1,4-beta-xylosidase
MQMIGAVFLTLAGLVGLATATSDELAGVARRIDVHADRTVGECYNFWSVSNFTSQDMFADPRARDGMRLRNPFMEYVNCVRLIGGRSDGKNRFFLGVSSAGEPQCDFGLLVSYLEGMLDWGYTPRIVLDNVPTAMSEPETMHTYGNTYPPKDYDLYRRYVRALVQALVDEFGADVVRQWRFRVMTEPDLFPAHWAGTREEYFKLYDYAVDAVCAVIADADIGPGNVLRPDRPHRGEMPWGLDIIDHAATGTNYRTGQVGTRLRFISCSWYGRVGESSASFRTAIEMMRDRLHAHPQFRDLPIEVAEFAVLHDDSGRRVWAGDTTEWAGSWLAGIADMVYELDVARVHKWATTAAGIPVPYTHTLSMLERMEGGQRLAVDVKPPAPADSGAIAALKDGRVMALVYNHRPPREPEVPETVTLTLHDARMRAGDTWAVSEVLVDREHGVFVRRFYDDCEAAGIETLPGAALFDGHFAKRFGSEGVRSLRRNSEDYRDLARPLQVRTDAPVVADDGKVVLHLDMPGHSVRFLEVRPVVAGNAQP